MDSLLEKLRAAAPQAKDQRDRRRRARLKERHQVRVASGSKPPEAEGEQGEQGDGKPADGGAKPDENGLLSPPITEEGAEGAKESQVSEGEDVADRAASMLLGLRSNSDANGDRLRRRRESADEERRNRRMRRRNGASGSKDSADGGLPAVQEPPSPSQTDPVDADNALPSPPPSEPPSIVVSEEPDAQESETGSPPNEPGSE